MLIITKDFAVRLSATFMVLLIKNSNNIVNIDIVVKANSK